MVTLKEVLAINLGLVFGDIQARLAFLYPAYHYHGKGKSNKPDIYGGVITPCQFDVQDHQ